MSEIKTNKLSIYLIKEEYSDVSDILKDENSLIEIKIPAIGNFYIDESNSYKPSWINNFFGTTLDSDLRLFNASSKAVLLINIQVDASKERIFALPFGNGRFLLSKGVWEERFGLKATLNFVNPGSLRSIDKKTLGTVPKHSREQISRDGVAADFGIDIEQDLIQAVTGKSKDKAFGKTITGKDSLNISAKININNIKDLLKACYERYTSDEYKKDFGWIDQISEIKNPKLIETLNKTLVENINSENFDKTWIAVPEIVDWADVAGFKYKNNKKDDLNDDLHIKDFLESLDNEQEIDINLLKKNKIFCFSASTDFLLNQWTVLNCLYCEIFDKDTNKTYLLSNGKWYGVAKDFSDQVNSDFKNFPRSTLSLPDYSKGTHENEGDYNLKTAIQETAYYACMDKQNISHGGGYSKIEFCDLYTQDKKIVHVKHYGGSSVLSHLFSQGVVSGELFLSDSEFRQKVNEKLPDSHKLSDVSKKPIPEDYEIIFAIISSSDKELEIPFFSKVNLRNVKRRLETFGYNVSLKKIPVIN